MKKSDLKNGAIVQIRNGNTYMKVDNTLFNINDVGVYLELDRYNDNLFYNSKRGKCLDIMKVDNDVLFSDFTIAKALVCYKADDIEWTWKREEKHKLTNDEIDLLKGLKVLGFKWIVRENTDPDLWVFREKPEKKMGCWYVDDSGEYFKTNLFPFVRWDNKEPYNIENLLGVQEDKQC